MPPPQVSAAKIAHYMASYLGIKPGDEAQPTQEPQPVKSEAGSIIDALAGKPSANQEHPE